MITLEFSPEIFERPPSEKSYDRVLFRPRVLQSQELNEMQTIFEVKLKNLISIFIKDGEITSGEWFFDGKTFTTRDLCIMVGGRIYPVEDAVITILPETKYICAKTDGKIISAKEDPSLLDPVDGENYHEEGALRLKVTASLYESKNVNANPVFELKNNRFYKAQNNLDTLLYKAYDHIINLETNTFKLETLPPHSRVIICGSELKLSAPLKISGTNIHVTFSPETSLVIESPSTKHFFDIKGSVKINGCRLIVKDKIQAKIAQIPKDSRLYIHDYRVSGLDPRSSDGEGILKINSVWEETHE